MPLMEKYLVNPEKLYKYLKLLIFIVNGQEFICKKSKPDSKKLAKSLVFLKFAIVFLNLTAWKKTRFEWA